MCYSSKCLTYFVTVGLECCNHNYSENRGEEKFVFIFFDLNNCIVRRDVGQAQCALL